jgi:hypothetical protein
MSLQEQISRRIVDALKMQLSPKEDRDLAVALIQGDRLDEAGVVLDAAPPEEVPTIAGRRCRFMKLALEGRRSDALSCVGDHLSTCAWNVAYWSWLSAECYAVLGEQIPGHRLARERDPPRLRALPVHVEEPDLREAAWQSTLPGPARFGQDHLEQMQRLP